MKRYVIALLLLSFFVAMPCQAQFMKKLTESLIGQNQQQQVQTLVGNVNLPPGQYSMTNLQTGQAFYVFIQNGQMFLSQQPNQQIQGQQQLIPGQTSGKGLIKNFLRNQLTPQTQPQQVPYQQQY